MSQANLMSMWKVSMMINTPAWYAERDARRRVLEERVTQLMNNFEWLAAREASLDSWEQFFDSQWLYHICKHIPCDDEAPPAQLRVDARITYLYAVTRCTDPEEARSLRWAALRLRAMSVKNSPLAGGYPDTLAYWTHVSAAAGCRGSTMVLCNRDDVSPQINMIYRGHYHWLVAGDEGARLAHVSRMVVAPFGAWRPNLLLMGLFPAEVSRAVMTWLLIAKRRRLSHYPALHVCAFVCTDPGWDYLNALRMRISWNCTKK